MDIELNLNENVIEKEAKSILVASSTSTNTKQAFFDWLTAGNAKKYSPSVAVACIDKISEYAVNKKICHTDLWSVTQHSVFKPIYTKILDTKLLRIMEKDTYKTFIIVGQLYKKFLREKPWNQANSESVILVTEDSNDSIKAKEVTSPVKSPLNQTTSGTAKFTMETDVIVYNWKNPTNVNGTKPYSITFKKNNVTIIVKSWKALLMNVYDYAVMTFPDIDITALTYGNGRRVLCSYKPNIVSYSEKLNCGLYVDTAWSANDVVVITKAILELCDADICGVEISYINKGTVTLTASTRTSLVETEKFTDEEKNVLYAFKETFPMSMNLGFADLMKLKAAYEQQFGSDILLSDDAVYTLIRNNAIKIADNRYTHIDNLVSSKTLESMQQFIENELSKSDIHSRVYVRPLYKIFKSDLSVAVNEDLLLTIIEIVFSGTYKANRKSMFITNCNNNNSLSISEEITLAIIKLLSEDIQPFSLDRIAQELPGYPKNKIEQALNSGDPEIVTVDGINYAHVDYVYIEDTDIRKIKNIISSKIAIDGYITINTLLNEIKENVSNVFECNEQISKQDIMKVIRQKIGSVYTYKKDWQNGDRFLPKEGA